MMEKPRISAIPVALVAATFASPRDVSGLIGFVEKSPEDYLGDVTRFTRGMIERECSGFFGLDNAIESNYHDEREERDVEVVAEDGNLIVSRRVEFDDARVRCAKRVAQAIDARLGPRRNIEVSVRDYNGTEGFGAPYDEIIARSPRRHSPNSGPR